MAVPWGSLLQFCLPARVRQAEFEPSAAGGGVVVLEKKSPDRKD